MDLSCDFHHFALRISNLKASVNFYKAILGFSEGVSFLSSNGVTKIQYLKRNDIILELTSRSSKLKKFTNSAEIAHIKHIAFSVKNIERAHRQLANLGVSPSTIKNKDINEYQVRYFFIFDPDGIEIEFVQYAQKD